MSKSLDLMKDEQVVYEGKLHWSVIAFSALFALLSIALSIGSKNPLFAIIGIGWFIARKKEVSMNQLCVTNKRVIMNTGWLSKKKTDILLSKVETVKADTGILGVGHLLIVGSGGTAATIKNLAEAEAFKNAIQEQLK